MNVPAGRTGTTRESLQVSPAKAEVDLARAAAIAAVADGGKAEALVRLDKARANCRQLHAALVKLKHAEHR